MPPKSAAEFVKRMEFPRVRYWLLTLMFSCVAVVAEVQYRDEDPYDDDRTLRQKFALATICISIVLSCLGFFFHAHPETFGEDKKLVVEGPISVILSIFWIVATSFIMDADEDIAVSRSHSLANINLFFASWICLFLSLVILSKIVKQASNMEEANLEYWVVFGGLSTALITSSAKIKEDTVCPDLDDYEGVPSFDTIEEQCRRLDYSIAVGSIGLVFTISAILMFLSKRSLKTAELILAFLAVALTVSAVSVLTFPEDLFSVVSTPYLSLWGAFVLAVFLFGTSLLQRLRMQALDEKPAEEENRKYAEGVATEGQEGPVETDINDPEVRV